MTSPRPASDPTRHRGTVLSIAAGQAVIEVAVQGCSSCGQKKSCGVGQLSGGGKTARVSLPARAGLAVGDVVSLSVPQSALNRAALLGYLLPATLLVIGSVLGHGALDSDLGAALGAAAGIAIGLLLVRFLPRLLPRFFGAASAPLTIE
ncbi:MAG TPA: SoxR reducing system RseC family protein [Rhodocyclaceae bacterium]|nr:SoxR reducing system RseC family protein [Rhodocyclaceae bacterium]